jgi:hypothetical protein
MLGYEFQPGGDQRRLLRGVNQGRLGPQANEALRVLALRLPNVLGGSPISPSDLLRPRVGGSTPGSAVVQSLRASGLSEAPSGLNTGAGNSQSAGVARYSPNPVSTGPLDDVGALARSALGGHPQAPTLTPGTEAPQVGPSGRVTAGPVPPTIAYPGDGPSISKLPSGGGNRGDGQPTLSAGPADVSGILGWLKRINSNGSLLREG